METEVAATFYNAKEVLPFWVTFTEMGHPQPPTPMEVDNETAISFLKRTIKKKQQGHWYEILLGQRQGQPKPIHDQLDTRFK